MKIQDYFYIDYVDEGYSIMQHCWRLLAHEWATFF